MFSRSVVGLTGLSHVISSGLSLGPAGAGGLVALRLALFRFPEPEIQFAPGADMSLRLLIPGIKRASVKCQSVPESAPDGVADWLRKEPFGIDRRGNRPVGDIVNVAFLGSRQQLENAFSAAGWAEAEPPSRRTKKQTLYAFNAMRAYATAPVSALFYKGMLPEIVFEKSLNTVTKRHHIRVWYAGVVDGQELWLGAATHDTGGAFSFRSFKFTHKIDPNVDDERDKVVTDLRFANCADPEMRVDRPSAASSGLDRYSISDGAACCLDLSRIVKRASTEPFVMPKPGNATTRLLRRMILEARNHVERDNAYFFAWEAIKRARNHVVQPNNQSKREN